MRSLYQFVQPVGSQALTQKLSNRIIETARAVGVDRATLYRYVKLGKLSLTRDEKGKRGGDAAELARVFPAVSQNVAPATAERVDLLQEKLKAAEEKCVLLRQQLSAATVREEWM